MDTKVADEMPCSGKGPIVYVPQKHSRGCVLACLAMVTGRLYDDIHALFSQKMRKWVEAGWKSDGAMQRNEGRWEVGMDFDHCGLSLGDGLLWLESEGYATRTAFRFCNGTRRGMWPLVPFAPVHICGVEIVEGAEHAVVGVPDGLGLRVLDPTSSALGRLSEYRKVNSMTGIYELGPSYSGVRTWEW